MSDPDRHPAIAALALTALLVGVTAVWGWTFTIVRDAVAAYGVLAFLAVRFAIAAAVLAPLSLRRLTRPTLLAGGGIGLVLGVSYLFQTLGLRYTTPTNSGLITGLFVIFTPFADKLLFRVRIGRLLWAAVGVSLFGMVLLVGDGSQKHRAEHLPGDVLTVGCAIGFAVHISLLSRYARGHDTGALALAQMLTVAVGAAIAWPLLEPVAAPPAEVWPALLICGVLASALAFYIQTFVQRRLPAVRTAVILTMEPLFAGLFGYLLAGDRLTAVQLAGAALLLCAIVLGEVVPAWQKARRPVARDAPNESDDG
jgi:drug/metabolite transporter (DMT)-like permease